MLAGELYSFLWEFTVIHSCLFLFSVHKSLTVSSSALVVITVIFQVVTKLRSGISEVHNNLESPSGRISAEV